MILLILSTQVDSYSAFYDNTGEEGAGSTGLAEQIKGSTEVISPKSGIYGKYI